MYLSSGITIGFHGCDRTVFDDVIKGGGHLTNSENSYDWLGHGIYFWEADYKRAELWAQSHSQIKTPAVIGAFIKLGNCIDLLDSHYLAQVRTTYDLLQAESLASGISLPTNSAFKDGISFKRDLDCHVIQRLQQINKERIAEVLDLPDSEGQNRRQVQNHPDCFDSVRGMFPEGQELYSGAGFRESNHIQLCIVNPNCILGYFNPRQRNSWYKAI